MKILMFFVFLMRRFGIVNLVTANDSEFGDTRSTKTTVWTKQTIRNGTKTLRNDPKTIGNHLKPFETVETIRNDSANKLRSQKGNGAAVNKSFVNQKICINSRTRSFLARGAKPPPPRPCLGKRTKP